MEGKSKINQVLYVYYVEHMKGKGNKSCGIWIKSPLWLGSGSYSIPAEHFLGSHFTPADNPLGSWVLPSPQEPTLHLWRIPFMDCIIYLLLICDLKIVPLYFVKNYFIFYLFLCSMVGGEIRHGAHLKSEDNLWNSILSFTLAGHGVQLRMSEMRKGTFNYWTILQIPNVLGVKI